IGGAPGGGRQDARPGAQADPAKTAPARSEQPRVLDNVEVLLQVDVAKAGEQVDAALAAAVGVEEKVCLGPEQLAARIDIDSAGGQARRGDQQRVPRSSGGVTERATQHGGSRRGRPENLAL